MKHISHYSAARIWDIPYLDVALGSYGAMRASQGEMIDITCSSRNESCGAKSYILHYCGQKQFEKALSDRGSLLVSSPPLLFLELASVLDIQHLILLGLMLVSHPPGKPDESITTKQELSAFIGRTKRCKGRPKALQALRYIVDGSASLMEAIAYMILTLPHTLGGYGLTGAVFNHEVMLTPEAQKRLKQKRCFVDLYYGRARLAIEYDSFAHHNNPADQAKDMLRASALERQGITVMRLGTVQLYDAGACKEFAYNLAQRLGTRIRIRCKSFNSEHNKLRDLLSADSTS